LLDLLLFNGQSVLVPDEIGVLEVKAVLLHASLKQADDVVIIGILGEAQTPAVLHEVKELLWLVLAQLLKCDLFLLLLDGRVLFCL
jgi:hypothetical protein